jgi:hypothetical protein
MNNGFNLHHASVVILMTDELHRCQDNIIIISATHLLMCAHDKFTTYIIKAQALHYKISEKKKGNS